MVELIDATHREANNESRRNPRTMGAPEEIPRRKRACVVGAGLIYQQWGSAIPMDCRKGPDGGGGHNRYGSRQSPTAIMESAVSPIGNRPCSGKLMARQSILHPGSTKEEARPTKLIVLTDAGNFVAAVESLQRRSVDKMARIGLGFPRDFHAESYPSVVCRCD